MLTNAIFINNYHSSEKKKKKHSLVVYVFKENNNNGQLKFFKNLHHFQNFRTKLFHISKKAYIYPVCMIDGICEIKELTI